MGFNTTEIKHIKDALRELEISHGDISQVLNLDKAIITKVLNGNYEGAEATKIKVLSYCVSLLEDKPLDLSKDILQHSEDAQELFNDGSLSKKYAPAVRKVFIQIYEALQKYNQTKNSNNKAA